eukprot:890079-Pleurochrysis_carterae.AAC.1
MVPRHRTPAIREGDFVSIAVRHFGEEYAIRRACHRNWGLDTIRDEGTVQTSGERWVSDGPHSEREGERPGGRASPRCAVRSVGVRVWIQPE